MNPKSCLKRFCTVGSIFRWRRIGMARWMMITCPSLVNHLQAFCWAQKISSQRLGEIKFCVHSLGTLPGEREPEHSQTQVLNRKRKNSGLLYKLFFHRDKETLCCWKLTEHIFTERTSWAALFHTWRRSKISMNFYNMKMGGIHKNLQTWFQAVSRSYAQDTMDSGSSRTFADDLWT